MLSVTRDLKLPTAITGSYPRPLWFECASSDGRDLALFGKYRTDKKIGIGVALVEGTNIVRRELGLPEARVRAADPTLYFASGEGRP